MNKITIMMLLRIFLSGLLLGSMLLAFNQRLDDLGRDYTEQGLKRALVTYGIARGLNGIISVAQGTELAVEPVGVGVTFTPGQILDPVNDLVERFSWIVLAAGTSLGMQRIFLSMTSSIGVSVALSLMLLLALLMLWKSDYLHAKVKLWIPRLVLVLLIIRFGIPLIALANEAVYRLFLEPTYVASMQGLESTSDNIEKVSQTPGASPAQQQGVLDRMSSMWQSTTNTLDIKAQLEKLKQAVSEISSQVIDMIVVFVLQTLVLPLAMLWLLYKLMLMSLQYGREKQND